MRSWKCDWAQMQFFHHFISSKKESLRNSTQNSSKINRFPIRTKFTDADTDEGMDRIQRFLIDYQFLCCMQPVVALMVDTLNDYNIEKSWVCMLCSRNEFFCDEAKPLSPIACWWNNVNSGRKKMQNTCFRLLSFVGDFALVKSLLAIGNCMARKLNWNRHNIIYGRWWIGTLSCHICHLKSRRVCLRNVAHTICIFTLIL